MPKSIITAFNWMSEPYPPELEGASAVLVMEDRGSSAPVVTAILTYIGSSVFHCTPGVQRQYDLDGWHKVGPYIRAIADKLKDGGSGICHLSVPKQTGGLILSNMGATALVGVPRVWPQVWANAAYHPSTTVPKGTPVANTPKSSDDDLVAMLTGAAGTKTAGATPATEPPAPEPRVPEGDPTSASIPPHRRSVMRNLRKPDDYIASLVK